MATSAPVLLRLVSSSVAIANRAGRIIRDIMSKGELGIVEKVGFALVRSSVRTYVRRNSSALSELKRTYHKANVLVMQMCFDMMYI